MARAFAAALESPDHGMSDEPTRVTQQVLAGTHPDVTVLATNKVTIGIDQVREIITTSEQMPATAPWRIIVIGGCGPHAGAHHQRAAEGDRRAGRTLHLAAMRAERPGRAAHHPLAHAHCESRRAPASAVAGFLTATTGVEPKVAQRAARLAEGHIGIAKLYATDEQVMTDRDELVVGVLNLARASDAVLLAGNLIDNAKAQAEVDANRTAADQEAEFRRINGLEPGSGFRRNCAARSIRSPRRTISSG